MRTSDLLNIIFLVLLRLIVFLDSFLTQLHYDGGRPVGVR